MSLKKNNLLNQTLVKILFLILPTLLLCYFLLLNANSYFSILNNQITNQILYLSAGMMVSTCLFSFRFRFFPLFLLLISVLFIIYQAIDGLSFGEFDAFFKSVRFSVFAVLFSIGFLVGYGFSRFKYFSIPISIFFLGLCIFLLSKQNELFFILDKEAGLTDYGILFGPVVFYTVYTIFTSNVIYSYEHQHKKIWIALFSKLFPFLLLCIILFSGVLWLQKNQIEETIEQFGGGGSEGGNSMLKKNEDNTFDLEEYSKLRGNLGRSNELLFAAHIDNYFPDTDIPNPLYLTSFYYSRFDTLSETFEKDTMIPQNDLFLPNPAKIPVFSILQDSSVLETALKEKFKKTVEIEVYKKQLSPSGFVAPSTSFFIQPITIEKDFQSEFHTAYRSKSYVSNLNSAYFVYNIDDPQVKIFQEQRFEVLRSVKNYNGVSKEIMEYYTFMPNGKQFDQIKTLSDSITRDKPLPIDKVIAIRDHFLAKDDNGNQIFTYTDNPGVPDIPSASKLSYFLFENKKGYCAYYAGATLFLLRSAGIPSRITAGFMTVERSNKNKGWYWFYADQAHAWVQIYFPGYGWLDFDTTVGNEDAIESPSPDGTPPLQPPKAFLVADGIVNEMDTALKTLKIDMNRLLFHDEEVNLSTAAVKIDLDAEIATIKKDSINVDFTKLQIGDSITAVSYALSYKNINKKSNAESIEHLLNRLPKPAQIDEIYIKNTLEDEIQKEVITQKQQKAFHWKQVIYSTLLVLVILFLIILLLPRMIWAYYQTRIRKSSSVSKKSNFIYNGSLFYLNQLGLSIRNQTPLVYSSEIDEKFSTEFHMFMKIFLKLKYSNQGLSDAERKFVDSFFPEFITLIKQQVPHKSRRTDFFKTFRVYDFFRKMWR